jgi:hypothetical protein
MITYQFMKIRQHNTFIFSSYCLIVSFDFRYLPFDFSCLSYLKLVLLQPNVTMTPEHMQMRFPT